MIFSTAAPEMAGRYRMNDLDAFPPIADLPPRWQDVSGLMLIYGRELQARTSTNQPTSAAEAVASAVWSHMELVAIHPFEEGNGRTARLVMNVFLMRYVTLPSLPVEFRKDERTRYIRCVQESRQGRDEPLEDFIVTKLEELAAAPRRRRIGSRFRRRRSDR